MARYELQKPRLYAEFNGYFGDVLCLTHGDACRTEHGDEVIIHEGMIVTAYNEDANDAGERDNLVATGVVERSPESLRCDDSVWCLRIDENGVRNESEIRHNHHGTGKV